MKAGWQSKSFEDCIEKVTYTAKIQRKDFLDSGNFPVVSQEEAFINGYWDGEGDVFRVESPVVVFGDHTRVLKYIDFDFVLGADGVKLLPPKEFLFPKFFFYQLQTTKLDSLGYARHYKLLKELDIRYPDIDEQKRIVAILDEAFDSIETARANAEKNLHNARALFDSHLETIFTTRGDGWIENTVEQLVEDGVLFKPQDGNHGEIHPKRSDYVEGGVPFIMACDLNEGEVDLVNCKFISKDVADRLRTGYAKHGDVLLSHKATIGRAAILSTNDDYVMLTPQVTYYRVKDVGRLFNKYLYFFFLSPQFQGELYGHAEGGSTRAYIGITKQRQLNLLIPPINDQKAISESLEVIYELAKRLESLYQCKLYALDELKKSLLHKAFSGEL